jgi:hypothetical protein
VVLGQVAGYAVGEVVAWLAAIAYAPLEGPKVHEALRGAEDILSRRNQDQLRQDGYFEAVEQGRPPVIEFFEGAIRAAARDHEARKAAYQGRFWANLAYEQGIDMERAAFLLRLAEDLTYRQIVLLAIFSRGNTSTMQDRLARLNAGSGEDESTVTADCAAEMQDLADRNLLGYLNHEVGLITNTIAANEGRFASLNLTGIRPAEAGIQLVCLLSLDAMPDAEQEHVLSQLG